MKMTKFKTICDSTIANFDKNLALHVNNKWQLIGEPRTAVKSDGTVEHFQTFKKEFDLSTDEAKALFNDAVESAKEL